MIKHYILTGDCHGEFSRFNNLNTNPEETAIIVLGDFSVDYYLNNNDKKRKYELCDKGFTYYIVRGNHEQRPELIDGITTIYDDVVKGNVYVHPDFPNIKYFPFQVEAESGCRAEKELTATALSSLEK